jgi:hypothetical protein
MGVRLSLSVLCATVGVAERPASPPVVLLSMDVWLPPLLPAPVSDGAGAVAGTDMSLTALPLVEGTEVDDDDEDEFPDAGGCPLGCRVDVLRAASSAILRVLRLSVSRGMRYAGVRAP